MVKAIGCLGHSLAWGITDWQTNPSPPSAPSLARLRYWMCDTLQQTDSIGSIVPLDFNASRQDTPTSAYDYNMAGGGVGQWFAYSFGPEVYGGLALADHLGTDVIVVKCAVGGSTATRRPVVGADAGGFTGWFWSPSHESWDTTLPRSATPYTVLVRESGTATATSLTTLTDGTKNWAVDEHKYRWITCDGKTGYCAGNTATTATVVFWYPTPFGPAPTPGAYEIQDRQLFAASLARTWLEGHCVSAKAAAGGTLADFDLDGVFLLLGELDATRDDWTATFADNLYTLIWWIRTQAVALGLTSLQAHQLKFVMPRAKEGTGRWKNAATTNAVLATLAACDPYFALVDVDDVTLGGVTGTDDIHYNTAGTITLGRKMGAAYVQLLTDPIRDQRSVRYRDQHVVVRPLWRGGGRLVATFAGLSGLPDRQYPACYLLRDGGAGTVPIFLSADGRRLTNRGPGAPVGWALLAGGPGMVEASALSAVDAGSRVPWLGPTADERVRGYVWGCSGGTDPFQETAVTKGSHLAYSATGLGGLLTRLRTTVAGAGIDREWLLRGHRADLALSGSLQIDERLGGVTWMRHRLAFGDYHAPQALGVGGMTAAVPVSTRALDCTVIPVDASPDADSPVPVGLALRQVDHGGASGLVHAVLWPNCRMRQRTELDWRGITGCIRVVLEATVPFSIHSGDEVTIELPVWAQNTFDRQFAYNPATAVETDATWDPTTNRFHELDQTLRYTFNKDGSLSSTGASWWTQDAGCVGWQGTGAHGAPSDLLTWALYAKISPNSRGKLPGTVRLGNWTEPLVGADAGFAAYDQRNYAYARQLHVISGVTWPAGTTFSVAMFLLVGTMAQVKAAADQLYALGVDATWTG